MVSRPSHMITRKQFKTIAKKRDIYDVLVKSKKENQERLQKKPDPSHRSE